MSVNAIHTKTPKGITPTSSATDETKKALGKVFAANAPYRKSTTPVLSGHSMGASFVISDYANLYRVGRDLMVATGAGKSLGLGHSLTKTSTAVGYHAFGMATGLNFIIGAVQVAEASKAIEKADLLGDKHASLNSRMAALKGLSLSSAGLCYAGYRGVAIASSIKPGVSVLKTVGNVLSQGGLACYAVFFVFLGAIFGVRLYEKGKLSYQLGQVEDITAAKELLEKKLLVDVTKLEKKLLDKCGSKEALKEHFKQEALTSGRTYLKNLRQELNLKPVEDAFLDQMIRTTIGKALEGSCESTVEEVLEQIGFDIEVDKAALKKEEKLKRILGNEGFAHLEKILKGTSEELEEALKALKSCLHFNVGIDSFVFGVCVFGLVLMVLSMVFTGGGAILPMLIVSLVFGLSMFAVDGYFLYESYRDETPVQNDTRMLLFSSSVAVVALGTVVGLSVAGVFSLGIVPLVAAVALCTLWLVQNGATYWIMKRNEKLFAQGKIEELVQEEQLVKQLSLETLGGAAQ